MEPRPIDLMVKEASKNIEALPIIEPRVYYDVIRPGDPEADPPEPTLTKQEDADVFRNQEQFPVRITHFSAQMQWEQIIAEDATTLGTDESKIQAMGIAWRHHDENYPNLARTPISGMVNAHTAADFNTTRTTATWTLPRPYILGLRDSLHIEVGLAASPIPFFGDVDTFRVAVALHGVGVLTGRPYFFSADRVIPLDPDGSLSAKAVFAAEALRNNSTEPIAITDITFTQPGLNNIEIEDAPTYTLGNINFTDVQIRGVGGGTQAEWLRGPSLPTYRPRCPTGLLGFTTGRCVTHKLPGDGFVIEPGDGLDCLIRPLTNGLHVQTNDDPEEYMMPSVSVALMGYLTVI
jgi:hypothetical protein